MKMKPLKLVLSCCRSGNECSGGAVANPESPSSSWIQLWRKSSPQMPKWKKLPTGLASSRVPSGSAMADTCCLAISQPT